MATTCQLLGPPEIQTQPPPGDTPMESLVSQTHSLDLSEKPSACQTDDAGEPPMGLTENLSATYLSSGNPCLDFFFHVVPDTPPDDLIERLQLAWSHNPLTTLKLICNLRGVRGTGKSDKEGFYTAAFWLHNHHPKTLASSVRAFVEFGYFKDLLEILYRILEGPEVRKIEKDERWRKTKTKSKSGGMFKRENRPKKGNEEKRERILRSLEEMNAERSKEKETARVLRKEREAAKAKKALDKYNQDPNYRFLHDRISDLFVDLLKSDIENLNSGKLNQISLAAKWCPTVDSSYDKSTLICEGIARKLFPRESDPQYQGIEEAHYVYRVRDRMRKQVLVPLHKALELPEVFMSAKQWGSLQYNRVASVAMKTYKELFLKHDEDRFKEYLENVKSGKAKIAAGALLPHEIIVSLGDKDGGEVAELQWKRMVEDMSKKGKLTNCIAICDVSGSMSGVPMEVSVALGVLVSELSEEPWKGKLITFSADPEIQSVEGNTLLAKTEFVRKMEWGMNTDFQKVFDRILEVAVEGKLNEDQMIKRVFVFSDMEFDQASGVRSYECDSECGDDDGPNENGWETDYQVIQRKFGERGYSKVPEIVFWNLRNSSSTPVVARQSGVALVSGFSKNLLTMFLEGGGVVNPEDVMELAISGEEYKKLVVVD
ncbi:uncharacterized protein LOC132297160 [Cornus florida]|uniref:uncharacterized protein LOC132297160 n=1 Tax=Cornus florida TaxID=4283 RepID=UPI0028A01A69|nr:uncharacterized protein LOC132297160 [Cornus florida]